jgi:hypothetical protein
VLGGALLCSAPPAAAAAPGHGNNRPHAATAAAPAGHGHRHGHAAAQSRHATNSARRAPAGSATGPRAPAAATRPPYSGRNGYDEAPPATGSRPPVRVALPAAASAAPANAVSTWHRDDPNQHDRGVVRAFATGLRNAGRSAGFPALLIAVMCLFLLAQHRLDRRDVKLSGADWTADQGLEFSAPSRIQPHPAASHR